MEMEIKEIKYLIKYKFVKIKYLIVVVIVKNHNVLKNIVNVLMLGYFVIIYVNVNNVKIY
jgi:hypothetical protein